MKTRGRYITIVTFVALAKAGAVLAAPCAPAAQPDEFAAKTNLTFPDFCDIPSKPTDIRPVQAFKASVVRTRLAGATLVRQTAPDTFSLSGTEAFAEGAKQEAAPPPPMTPPGEAETEAFVKQSKAKATPPHRPR